MTGPVVAAAGVPAFMPALAIIVVAAAVAAWVCQRLKLVPIVGFLLAGMVVGPHALGLVERAETVEAAAEIGVILLLFALGIEFSLERLNRVKRLVLAGGAATVVMATLLTAAVVMAMGEGPKVAIYTGLLVSVSSTAIVLTLLSTRGETMTEGGQASVAILIFEDLAVVAMVLLVPMLGTDGGSGLEVARVLLVSIAVITAVLTIATRLMPRVLEAVARVCSPEVFLLAVIAICFGTAYLTSLVGVSVSLGAFLAGLLVSESRFSSHALGEILPLQIVFTATFFLSVGMLFDPGFLVENPGLVVAAVVTVLVIKSVTGTVAVVLAGVALPVAVGSALLRAQIGEFSFVLEQAGREAGLTPAGLGTDGVQAFLGASVLLMVATPALAPLGAWLAGRLARPQTPVVYPASGEAGETIELDDGRQAELRDHVLVAGYGLAAGSLVSALRSAGVPLVVTTLNPAGALEAERAGVQVLRGDATKGHTLERAGIRRSRVVVVADDDTEVAQRISSLARSMTERPAIVVHAPDGIDLAALGQVGVDRVVTGERASREQLRQTVLRHYDEPGPRPTGPSAPAVIDTDRFVRVLPSPTGTCRHLDRAVPVLPSALGCEDCLRTGGDWVHLRVCLACGHVGCCDDSQSRHARVHWSETEHPVIRSIEPGETWAWCFVDEADPTG